MLTAGALHAVNATINNVMSVTPSEIDTRAHFGMKSIVAVGDLFQLPAVVT